MSKKKSNYNSYDFDLTGVNCLSGCGGIYTETELDDLRGVLHCSKCGEETVRYATAMTGVKGINGTVILKKCIK
jgi:hypothetical protein